MKENEVNIKSNSILGFTEILDLLNKLPDSVREQIETAEKNIVGTKCVFRKPFGTDIRIYLPDGVTQIKDFGDYIGIYAGEYFFVIEKDTDNKKLEYVFLPKYIPTK